MKTVEYNGTNMIVLTDPPVENERGVNHQIGALRFVNRTLQKELTEIKAEREVLRAHISVLLGMLCDAGIPLPPDVN